MGDPPEMHCRGIDVSLCTPVQHFRKQALSLMEMSIFRDLYNEVTCTTKYIECSE